MPPAGEPSARRPVRWETWRRLAAPVGSLSLLAVLGLVQLVFGTLTPENDGLGFDGVLYARIAREPAALDGNLDVYSAQRVVPSLAVRLLLEISQTPPVNEAIRLGFAALNLALLLVVGAVWWALSSEIRLSGIARWLGFSLLFLNLGNLRLPFFYSPLTDTSAFALGAALVFFHLRRSDPGMLVILALGALTWRPFLLLGVPLYLFPRGPASYSGPKVASAWPATAAALLLCSVVGRAMGAGPLVSMVLSVTTVTAFVGAVVVDLLLGCGLRSPAAWHVAPRRVAVVIGLAGGVALVIFSMSRQEFLDPGAGSIRAYPLAHFVIHDVLGRGMLFRPAEFFSNHVRFYGLTPLLVALLWGPVLRAVHSLGPGMTIYLALHLLMVPNPESRQLIDGHFGIILALGLATAAEGLPARVAWITAVFGLLTSRVWLPEAWGGPLVGLDQAALNTALAWLPLPLAASASHQAVLGVVTSVAAALLMTNGGLRRKSQSPPIAAGRALP